MFVRAFRRVVRANEAELAPSSAFRTRFILATLINLRRTQLIKRMSWIFFARLRVSKMSDTRQEELAICPRRQ